MIVEIDGNEINDINEFHTLISELFDFGPYYGRNPNALKDFLSTEVERPCKLIWYNSHISRKKLGEQFDKIIIVFDLVIKYENEYKKETDPKFIYELL